MYIKIVLHTCYSVFYFTMCHLDWDQSDECPSYCEESEYEDQREAVVCSGFGRRQVNHNVQNRYQNQDYSIHLFRCEPSCGLLDCTCDFIYLRQLSGIFLLIIRQIREESIKHLI